jgi:hypothetical protein
VDGPQFKTHTAWLVTCKLDILLNLGQAASLSLCHCRTANRKAITWYQTVNINTLYTSLWLSVFSLFQWYALMYKIKSKTVNVKLNSALKNTDTDLQIGIQTHHTPCAITGVQRSCWSPSIYSQMSLHRCTKQKNVMDPWPAPYQNSNGYWWPWKIWGELPSNISNLYSFNTVLHQRTLQGRRSIHKSDVLLPLYSNATSPLRWRISLFNDASLHLLTDSNKSPRYYILYYKSPRLGWLSVSPLSTNQRQIL